MAVEQRKVSRTQAETLFGSWQKLQLASVARQEAEQQLLVVKALVADALGVKPEDLVNIDRDKQEVTIQVPDPAPEAKADTGPTEASQGA
jgi:hypothetical protein